ncbi:uncharacterized protein LOC134283551 [Saccostrea cucullata]|uniref:uncharacterized protein LOC134283551 n=1 Tax=Saccostrea cuccullata TaxID=36930 RepID=UPI002ED4E6C9
MADIEVVNRICQKFNLKSLTDQQISAIDALKKGKDTFVGTKTGSGKSLVYESSPIVLGENGVTTVLAPLNSIMSEQIERLNRLGYRAVQVSNDTDKQAVMNGYFQFVFGSPELLVGDDKWREVLRNPIFTSKNQLIVVDEAHTVIQWGLEHQQEGPFREWFAHIGEMRSLCIGVPILALTATASPTHRRQIMQKLCFRHPSCVILDSPDRSNIKLNVLKVKNNVELENVFQWLTAALVENGQELQRHLIFCNSIKDCAMIYMLFLKICGPTNHFNMYHSKTTDATKEKIRKDMNEANGRIKVLICTNAAGMGVNFQNLNNIVHYGPPRDLDNLVQQMGRAGRDGSPSNELIIYKANQLQKVDDDVIKLLKSTSTCRRKILNEAYMKKHTRDCDHLCCDICELMCKCQSEGCPSKHSAKETFLNLRDEDNELDMRREIGGEEKAIVQQRLQSLKDNIFEGTKSFIHSDIVCGFSVQEIIAKLPFLFTVNDILDKTSVDSFSLASKIIQIITEIFNDNEMYALEEIDSD